MSKTSDILLLAYYGDDFTGSADVMEALTRSGYRTVLFLKPPTPEHLANYPGLRAFGIAGGSRTMSPEEMERELPAAFEALKASGARIAHYKVCSTFDSSPTIGSIGKAIELGRQVFGERPTPLAVGLPLLGRYVAFGNLFARSGLDTEPCRLDRHPTMSRHPVTPMNEADLRVILGTQTSLPVELIDVLKLETALAAGNNLPPRTATTDGPPPITLFDTVREAHLLVIGREIERLAEAGQLFVVGSSAVEHALVACWKESFSAEMGRTQRGNDPGFSVFSQTLCLKEAVPPSPAAPSQMIVVSGSCSPVTDRQIAQAVAAGFSEIALDPMHLLDPQAAEPNLSESLAIVRAGRSLILHTSRGPTDRRLQHSLASSERETLGRALGALLDRLLQASGLKRAVVCGGDTSMAVARALGIEALEFASPAAPGSPLCLVHAPGRNADGCEMVFKGGQNGRDRFLLDVSDLAAGENLGQSFGGHRDSRDLPPLCPPKLCAKK
jgi:uncharacterized protein YgbK (DUF1537 family)